MRIAICGMGFGRHLFDTLLTRDDCQIVAAVDFFAERLAPAKLRGIATYDDVAKMVREAKPDAIVIATAPHVRNDALEAALAAGIPVFMEKPLAGTVKQARHLAERCAGHPVMMGFSFRFHAPVQALLSQIGNVIGPPSILNASYMFDWLPDGKGWLWEPEKGGGFFNENSCHLFDVVCAVMGTPKTIFASGFDNGERPSATAAAISMRFESGAVAALTVGGVGTSAFDNFPRLELHCENGQALMTGRQHMWTGLRWAKRGDEQSVVDYEPEALNRTRYSAAFDHFFAPIAAGKPFDATVADGLMAVRIADAVYKSINTRQAVTLEELT